MYFKLVVIWVSVLLPSVACGLYSYDKVINFPEEFSLENYVLLKPDFSEVREKMTICSWVKKTKDNTDGTVWFSYAVATQYNELILFDGLRYVYLFGSHLGGTGIGTPLYKWLHYCFTWNNPGQFVKLYINGALKASWLTTVPDRELGVNGTLVLGQEQDAQGGGFELRNTFAGEIYQLNVFKRALTDEEIEIMFRNGRCSFLEHSLLGDVVLSWENILQGYRNGKVSVAPTGCKKWNWNWDILQDFIGQEITENLIEHLKRYYPLNLDNILVGGHS